MSLRILFLEIVGVVGTDHGQARFLMDAQNSPVHHRLVPDAMVLELQVEMIRAKQLRQLQGIPLGIFIFPVPQAPGNLPRQARGQGHQAPAVLPEKFQVDPWLDIKALRPGLGDHIREVPVALLILTEKDQVAALGVKLVNLIREAAALCRNVDFTATNGLDALRLTGPVKVHRTVHDPVVRNGASSLAQLLDNFRQVPDAARTVQEAVLCMDMQMNEGHGPSPFLSYCFAGFARRASRALMSSRISGEVRSTISQRPIFEEAVFWYSVRVYSVQAKSTPSASGSSLGAMEIIAVT